MDMAEDSTGSGERSERVPGGRAAGAPYTLRPHRSGDLGWIVHRHGVLYQQEYGWGMRFEALVARTAADFIDHFDPARERCWIAEREGERLGSVLVTKMSDEVAKLRLLLVEPSARGMGLGHRLVDECIRFARQAGYRRMMLWTETRLVAARRIYDRAGFRMVHQEADDSFGFPFIAETWEREL
jgi:GNAT superfamily N-acetyltransferase